MQASQTRVCVIVLGMGAVVIDVELKRSIDELVGSHQRGEVVVVVMCNANNAADDGYNAGWVFVSSSENLGYAAAMNHAAGVAPAAESQRLIFLTADARPSVGALDLLLRCLDDPSVAVAAPVIVTPSGRWFGGTWHERWGWARHLTTEPAEPVSDVKWSTGYIG